MSVNFVHEKRTVVFVLPQDYGHFGYVTHIANELYRRGFCIEYWSHRSAQSQCPSFASSFNWLADDQSFIEFYCQAASQCDSDVENIRFLRANMEKMIHERFPKDKKLSLTNMYGHPDRVAALKRRLLLPDVMLCVNDNCHLFSFVGRYCDNNHIPTMNLYPTQHELQRQYAGVLADWQAIFTCLGPEVGFAAPPSCIEAENEPTVRADGLDTTPTKVPTAAGLYITYEALIDDLSAIPADRCVVGPVYPPPDSEAVKLQLKQLAASGLQELLEREGDTRCSKPVVYVSLGSMVKLENTDAARAARTLLRALTRDGKWRVLSTLPLELLPLLEPTADSHDTVDRRNRNSSKSSGISNSIKSSSSSSSVDSVPVLVPPLEQGRDLYLAGWVPQFAVLAHPSVKVFISHCGANSVHESIYHAVPVVGLPFFDDQRYNAPKLVELGLSPTVLLKGCLDEEEIIKAVSAAIHDPKYKENMRIASERVRANNGLQRVVDEAMSLIEFSTARLLSKGQGNEESITEQRSQDIPMQLVIKDS